ncbi:MAG TPA: helix-turn-helix domain-containing protein [Candidatus Sulfotelmatobacter sp.]|nr:helix-turn-helix domain-containing protein [Candidatus Sulfotelmatobacter sp.]
MNHWEANKADSLGMVLKEAGFQISQLCCSRPSCFDFAAKKDEDIVLIKLYSDIDAFSRFDSHELRVIAGRISAAPLIISDKTHDKPLEDDTAYSRYSIYVVTEKTLKNTAFKTGYPLVNASPGGYFVEVDGTLIEKRRGELSYSIGQLAGMIGVSRRTLYGYERCMAKASVTSAYNLAKVLGVPVAKPINILDKMGKQRVCLLSRAKRAIASHKLLRKIFKKFSFCDISLVQKAPFDLVMKIPEEERLIFAGFVSKDDKFVDARIEEILSVSRVVNANPILITETGKSYRNDIFCVSTDELAAMHSPLELVI